MNVLSLFNSNRRFINVVAIVFLVFYTIWLYYPTIYFDFVYFDDDRLLLRHSMLYECTTLSACFNAFLTHIPECEEPLVIRNLTWLLDAKIFGFQNPMGYHISNILYHASVVVLAFVFLLRFTRHFYLSFLVTFLYSSLAIHTESVGWIMGRKDILSGVFLFLLLNTEISYSKAVNYKNKYSLYFITILLVTMACLSKISSLSFCFVLLMFKLITNKDACHDYFFRRSILEVIPHFTISLFLYVWYASILEPIVLNKTAEFSYFEKIYILLFVNPLVFLKYLMLILSPAKLSVVYSWQGIHEVNSAFDCVLSAAVLFTLSGFLIFLFKKRFYKSVFCFLSVLALLAPYSNLVNFGWWYANRYIYVASFFLIAAIGIAIKKIANSRVRKILVNTFFICILLINTVQAKLHIPAWKNIDNFCDHHLAVSQTKQATISWCIKIVENYSNYYPDEKRQAILKRWLEIALESSKEVFDNDLRIRKDYALLNYSIGRLYFLLGVSLDKQLYYYKRSFELDSDYLESSFTLAQAYLEKIRLNNGEHKNNKEWIELSAMYFVHYFKEVDWNLEVQNQYDLFFPMFSNYPEVQKRLEDVRSERVR